ncbi:MAG: hypothetical protein FWF02_12510 [Micrococcales bacterium]|nr:hypothetical protein [Micrococcales bacterium]MCL2668499.1 hypothetical protein [Micrococcales bacterium]
MLEPDEFAGVRRDPDPVSRARRATALLSVYQQRSTELARLRRVAVEEAHRNGMAYVKIADEIGLTKGRITQIRSSAPGPERALFGVGPVTVVVPYRRGHERLLLAAEDVAAGDHATRMLDRFGFTTTTFQLEPTAQTLPAGDLFVICGPKSAPAAAHLVEQDPLLTVDTDGQRWHITERATGVASYSPMDDGRPEPADVAYVSRRTDGQRVVTHVAGLHAIGSLGAVQHLAEHAAEIYQATGETSFSLVVASTHDGLEITSTTSDDGPQPWPAP